MKLFEYAYCGNYNASVNSLAMLAPEKWSFGSNNDNSILKNYIEHTFCRLLEENKVMEKKIMRFLIQDCLMHIINQYVHTL